MIGRRSLENAWKILLTGAAVLLLSGCPFPPDPPTPPTPSPVTSNPVPAPAAPDPNDPANGGAEGVIGTQAHNKEAIVMVGEVDPGMDPAFVNAVHYWAQSYHVHWIRGPHTLRAWVKQTLGVIAGESHTPPEYLLFHWMGHAGGTGGQGIFSHVANEYYSHINLANDLHASFASGTIYQSIFDACYQAEATRSFPISAAGFQPPRQGVVITASGEFGPDPAAGNAAQCAGVGAFSTAFIQNLQANKSWADATTAAKQYANEPQYKEYP